MGDKKTAIIMMSMTVWVVIATVMMLMIVMWVAKDNNNYDYDEANKGIDSNI